MVKGRNNMEQKSDMKKSSGSSSAETQGKKEPEPQKPSCLKSRDITQELLVKGITSAAAFVFLVARRAKTVGSPS
jgi:hypothetical protein